MQPADYFSLGSPPVVFAVGRPSPLDDVSRKVFLDLRPGILVVLDFA
jgi:hypothetical protein